MRNAWPPNVKCLLPAASSDAYHLSMQAKIVKSIAAEEEWLRLLVHELAPVIEHLHADELPLSRPPHHCLTSTKSTAGNQKTAGMLQPPQAFTYSGASHVRL